MKTRRNSSFFSAPPESKKPRINDENDAAVCWLPEEIWIEIFKHLNKESLRNVAQVDKEFLSLIQKYELIEQAPWPELNYARKGRRLLVRASFKWHRQFPIINGDEGQPIIYSLDNGDVAVAMFDGRLIVLRCRTRVWKYYGSHESELPVRRLKRKIHDVISLRSNEIASCDNDGIRIWDNKSGRQKYLLNRPDNPFKEVRPMILKKLPNHQFAAGCSDGSVHLWRLAANDQYQYHQQLDVGDDSDAHSLRVLAYENGRLFGEFNQFIVRWDASNGRLLDRMAYSSLRAILINAVIDLALDSNLNADNMILDIEWGLSNDYVFVCIDDTYRFLVKLFDEKVKPFFLGYQDHTKYKVTTAGDLVVLRDINGLELLAGWNKLTNTFSRRENLPFSNLTNCLIGADGRIFNWLEDVCKVYIYDPYQNRHAKLKLQIRDAQRFRALLVVLSNGDLLGKRRNGHLSIWDGKTGKLKNRNIGLPFYGSDVNELKNGDLLKTDKIHVHLHPVRATVVNIHRFGLRK